LKFLDCFCGLGGASEGFFREGFDVTGIDIVNVGYPYRLILGDMTKLKGEDFKGYDVIWGSPPCRDFTRIPDHALRADGEKWRWKVPKDRENGLLKVRAFLKFVEDAKPIFWVMENVSGLAECLPDIKPRAYNCKILNGKRHVFYGNYPSFLMPMTVNDKLIFNYGGKLRAWERARIPLACSQAFARACKEQLLEKEISP